MDGTAQTPAVPRGFRQHIRALGPGIVVALTWLGAGDLVDSAVAGGNYGYALMWAMALALFVRFVFVSIVAKYQLCNRHGESVLSGFKRIHAAMPLFVGAVGLIFGHIYGSFLVRGLGLASEKLFGFGWPFLWSAIWVSLAAVLVFRGLYRRLELAFYAFLFLLGVSIVGVAAWSGPDPAAAARGVLLFAIPEQQGSYGALLIIVSLIGAVGGSIANLLYPYFIQQKGWKGPRFRRLQLWDLGIGVGVLVFLNLSVWTIGAEVLHARGETIDSLDDLAKLLTIALGDLGAYIFYIGVFAAVYSSVIGGAMGFGYLFTDSVRVHRARGAVAAERFDVSGSAFYRAAVLWCLFSPLAWSLPGAPDFIVLTIVGNAASVLVLPILCGALWLLTARTAFIGAEWRNGLWENGFLAALFALSIWGAWQSAIAIAGAF